MDFREATMMRTAGELADYLGATLQGEANQRISGVASLESAGPEDLIYVDSAKRAGRAAASAAKCVLAPANSRITGKTVLEAEAPKFAFAKAAAWILPAVAPRPGIHPTAVVAASARVGHGVHLGPYVVVEEDAEIGPGAVIEAFCFLGRRARVGENCRL